MKLKTVLKELIKERDLTVSKLSRLADVPQQTIHNWLSGQSPQNLSQVKSVANYFGVTVDYLCFEEVLSSEDNSNFEKYESEINAGVYEVILRKIRK